jgi:TonB family protein
VPRTLSNAALVSATSSSDGATIVPPKLIKSVRAIAAPEALQDFATGDVKLDAVVDATGHVKSMKALSGPGSLRTAAMKALKEYRYEPARRNGTPVAAHVTVTIKFLFEP